MKTIKGDCTWTEQFNYIYLCFKEIVKMAVMGDRYNPTV